MTQATALKPSERALIAFNALVEAARAAGAEVVPAYNETPTYIDQGRGREGLHVMGTVAITAPWFGYGGGTATVCVTSVYKHVTMLISSGSADLGSLGYNADAKLFGGRSASAQVIAEKLNGI